MPVLPYFVCLAEGSFAMPASGVGGKPVETLEFGALAAAYSEVESFEPSAESARQFAEVVLGAFRGKLLLPFHFPSVLDDREALQRHLIENALAYGNFLAEHREHVQMELRVPMSASLKESNASSGTEYLRRKSSATADAQRIAEGALQPAKELILDRLSAEMEQKQQRFLRTMLLIDRSQAAELRQRLSQLPVSATLLGPVPPSEFFEAFRKTGQVA